MPEKVVSKNVKHFEIKIFALQQDLKQGDIIPIQILKYANRTHPFYGKILIDEKYFNNVIRNFENNVRKDEIPINLEHDRTAAQAWIKKVYSKWDELWADIELTKNGADNLNGKHYKYFSAELSDKYQDPDTMKRFENVLVGGALTNYPYFNGMDKIVASDPSEETKTNTILSTKNETVMLKDLLLKFSSKEALSFDEKVELTKTFSEATEDEKKELQAETEATLNKYSDPEKEAMKEELAQAKAGKRFSEIVQKFSTIHAFNQEAEEEKVGAEKVLKAFSKLDDEEVEEVKKLFSNYQKVVDTLTNGQISQNFAKKEDKEEEKMSTDWKKKVVSESAFNKICNDYAKDKNVDFNKAYEALKDGYEIEKKK